MSTGATAPTTSSANAPSARAADRASSTRTDGSSRNFGRHPPEVRGCPFCERVARGDDIIHARAAAVAFPDAFPLSEGHVLVVPRRHLARVEDLESNEWAEVFALVREVCRELADHDGVDGVNVGVNSGVAAGQTVDHAHVHVIPRRLGDVPDPRGGIRRVVPDRANYWSHG
jgi:diadenosine tetraphosphate (Ap4A) HIT family hydrolase